MKSFNIVQRCLKVHKMVQMVFMRFLKVRRVMGLHESNVEECSEASGAKWTYQRWGSGSGGWYLLSTLMLLSFHILILEMLLWIYLQIRGSTRQTWRRPSCTSDSEAQLPLSHTLPGTTQFPLSSFTPSAGLMLSPLSPMLSSECASCLHPPTWHLPAASSMKSARLHLEMAKVK